MSTRAIRTKDPSSACIVDEGCQFVLSVLQAILGDEVAAKKYEVHDVAQVVRASPDLLKQVGASKTALCITRLDIICTQQPQVAHFQALFQRCPLTDLHHTGGLHQFWSLRVSEKLPKAEWGGKQRALKVSQDILSRHATDLVRTISRALSTSSSTVWYTLGN